MDPSKYLRFFAGLEEIKAEASVLIARLNEDLRSEEALFADISRAIQVPGRIDDNWDTLFDYLCDLQWIEPRVLYLVHSDLPRLREADLETYLDLIVDVVRVWRNSPPSRFEAYFSENDRVRIKFLLKDYEAKHRLDK